MKKLIDYLRDNYLLFIGAGCVATAGLISMFKTLPMIVRSVRSGISSLRGGAGAEATGPNRYDYDMSMRIVLFGSFGLLALLALFLLPQVGWIGAVLGAVLTLVFGFLFVTVSSRLTGEIGSTSNPISGMTVAALLMTCLIFLALGMTNPEERVLALCVGGVVCIAASNGGTTSQDLKTGYLLGATPRYQQFAILVGALTSAVVIGGTLMLFNSSQTIYSDKPEHFPKVPEAALKQLTAPGATAERKTIDGINVVRWNPDKSNPIRTATEPDGYWVEVTEEKPAAAKDETKAEAPEPKPVLVGRVRFLIDPNLPTRKAEEYKDQAYRVWYA
ncbi:MAG TPA: OPT/YSL family transporter, partial [Chloroflexota bacterium]|nr:OPT/YSL family transporter [Chloroflexota bacterium]